MNSKHAKAGAGRRAWLGGAACALFLLAPLGARAAGEAGDDAPPPEALWLEERLLAPCCWLQTLDGHESPLASELRADIRRRLRAGEAAAAIEDDLVARFGERMRAVPKGRDPRAAIPVVAGAGLALVLGALALTMRRWLRAGRRAAQGTRALAAAAAGPDDAAYEARLDDELRALDG
ncbi:MAG TPA: cytochrome c-type biogenesis protein CcmH [Polyangiaceae bacterium]|nr:cytochrome c-type biogenesis protein CcmH [Polyangiaceae bacterium]